MTSFIEYFYNPLNILVIIILCFVLFTTLGSYKEGLTYYKIPKLTILYQTLFGVLPDEERIHNALYDVLICIRCFYMMRYKIDIIDYNRKIRELIN